METSVMLLMIGVPSASGMPLVGLSKALSPLAMRPAGALAHICIAQVDTEIVDVLDVHV